jgi:hypothetical protein
MIVAVLFPSRDFLFLPTLTSPSTRSIYRHLPTSSNHLAFLTLILSHLNNHSRYFRTFSHGLNSTIFSSSSFILFGHISAPLLYFFLALPSFSRSFYSFVTIITIPLRVCVCVTMFIPWTSVSILIP